MFLQTETLPPNNLDCLFANDFVNCGPYPGKDKDGNNFIYGLTRYDSSGNKIWDGQMFEQIYKYFCKQESKVYIYENTNLTAEISSVGTIINPNPITTNSKQNYFGYQVYLSNNKFMSCSSFQNSNNNGAVYNYNIDNT